MASFMNDSWNKFVHGEEDPGKIPCSVLWIWAAAPRNHPLGTSSGLEPSFREERGTLSSWDEFIETGN